MKKIETRTAEISLVEKGIVRVKFRHGTILDKDDIIENLQISVKLSGGKHCALLEINNSAGITDKALRFAESQQNAEYRIANALLIKSASVKLLWSFFSTFCNPSVHNATFMDEKKALDWLRSFIYGAA